MIREPEELHVNGVLVDVIQLEAGPHAIKEIRKWSWNFAGDRVRLRQGVCVHERRGRRFGGANRNGFSDRNTLMQLDRGVSARCGCKSCEH
jgi:hypothetical protein